MSYCRWSSNDYQCDLYIYGSGEDEVTIHVASGRHVVTESLPAEVPFDDIALWVKRQQEVSNILRRSSTAPIGLPCDGESYCLPYAEAGAKVRDLIAMGYQCDPSVADDLDADARQEARCD